MLKKPGTLRSEEILYVITPVFNPLRFHSRYRLHRQYVEHMSAFPNVRLVVVEAAYGDRKHEVTEEGNPLHIQLRTKHLYFMKESLIRIGVQHLPPHITKFAWIDGDVHFTNPHWVTETLHQLEHYAIVQLFQHAIDLGPEGNTAKYPTHVGVGYQWVHEGLRRLQSSYDCYERRDLKAGAVHYHPGLAWAMNLGAYDAIGGLIDWMLLGSQDNHMARCWLGCGSTLREEGLWRTVSEGLRRRLVNYEEVCERTLHRSVGYVAGTILHYWHGKTANRGYYHRNHILVKHAFDPDTDLILDRQGLYQINPAKPGLIRDVLKHFQARQEDSIDE
jgi:hypothetical protein